MFEFKFDVDNFKKHYERFSYIFYKFQIFILIFSFAFIFIYKATKNDTFLLLFGLFLFGSIFCALFTLAHIDNLKRKNKDLTLKIDLNNNLIGTYRILKLERYSVDSSQISLYGYFVKVSEANEFYFKRYILNFNIPRQYEKENEITEKLDMIKDKTQQFEVNESNFVRGKVNFTPLGILMFVFILMSFITLFIGYTIVFIMGLILVLADFILIVYLYNDHANDVLVFKKDCIEYENLYGRSQSDDSRFIESYVRKYKITNIKSIKVNRLYITISGDIEYNWYRISTTRQGNVDDSLLLQTTNQHKLFIINTFGSKEKLYDYINKYIKR